MRRSDLRLSWGRGSLGTKRRDVLANDRDRDSRERRIETLDAAREAHDLHNAAVKMLAYKIAQASVVVEPNGAVRKYLVFCEQIGGVVGMCNRTSPHAASWPDHDENSRDFTISRHFPIIRRSIKQIPAIYAQQCSGGVITVLCDYTKELASPGWHADDRKSNR